MGVWALHSFHSSRELQLFAAHLNLDVPKRTKCPKPFLHVRHSLTVNLLSQSQAIWTAVLSINRQETLVPLLRLGTSQCGKEHHWTSAQTLFFSWDMFTADSSVWSKWFKLDPHIFAYERPYLFSHIAQTLQSYQHPKNAHIAYTNGLRKILTELEEKKQLTSEHLFYVSMPVSLVSLIACMHEQLSPSFRNVTYYCLTSFMVYTVISMFKAPSAKCSYTVGWKQ